MPSLDVSEVLTDPDLADTFEVRRSHESVGEDGRTVKTFAMFPNPGEPPLLGVINWDTGHTKRRDDSQISDEKLTIVTHFSLRDMSFGYQPDVVIWRGGEYMVKNTAPFRHFGSGWTKAELVSTRATDRPAPA